MSLATKAMMAAALFTSCAMSGCLVSGSSHSTMSGSYVGRETFSQIEPGVTKLDWINATMGTPTCKSTLDDGSEIWKWTYTKKASSSGAVFLIFGGHDVKESAGATFVQLRDGVVIKAWQD